MAIPLNPFPNPSTTLSLEQVSAMLLKAGASYAQMREVCDQLEALQDKQQQRRR
jgi:hypothetical protein